MRYFNIGSNVAVLTGLIILTILTIAGEAIAENPTNQTFPYTTYVLENGSYVRSGPGKAYYPTERLKTGDAVEVYRHDPGGWLAIRPTKSSFTWIRSRYLKPLGDGLAEVTGARVAARMGSRLDDSKDVIQVRLHQGETVELVDSRALDGGGQGPWVKIRPPSGEFRWIHGSLVDRESTASGLRRPRQNHTPITPRSARARPSREVSRQVSETVPYDGRPMHFTHDQRPQPDDRDSVLPARYMLPEENGWDFEEAIAELDIELSEMVASNPETWAFDRIAMDAKSLSGYSQTAIQRGRIREVLSKIDRFKEIQDRKMQLVEMLAQQERQKNQLAMRSARMSQALSSTGAYRSSGDTIPAASQVAMVPLDNRFDGTGILRRVKPVSKGAPNFALLDDAGRIRCYITPAPDVSLDYYKNRRIGVTGNRGYMPNQRKHHVMAQHIQLLR